MAIFAAGAAVIGGGLSFLGAREQADAIEQASENNRFLFNSGQINGASPFANVTTFGPGNQITAAGNVSLGASQAAINPANFDFSSLAGGQPAVGNGATRAQPSAFSPATNPFSSVGAVDQLSSQGSALVGAGSQNTIADNANFSDGLRINDAGSSAIGFNASLGNLNPAFDGLTALATQGIGQAGLAGITPEIQQAFNNQQAAFGAQINGDFGTLDALAQGTGQQFGFANQAAADLSLNGFQRGLQDAAFAGANSLIDNAAVSSQDASAEALQLLRDQARLSEDRQFQDLQENLFATGRLGTSGGALQTEAFARGLAEADNDRQILALQEGRNAGTFDLNQAAGLAGVGAEQAALEDQLLNSAFNRFSTTTANGINLSDTAVARQFDINNFNTGQATNAFGSAVNFQTLTPALQQAQLDFALSALGGQETLNDQSLNNLAANQNQQILINNALTGNATNATNLALGGAEFAGGGFDVAGQVVTGLGPILAEAFPRPSPTGGSGSGGAG